MMNKDRLAAYTEFSKKTNRLEKMFRTEADKEEALEELQELKEMVEDYL